MFFLSYRAVTKLSTVALAVAAATENDNDCEDYDPGAVIIKKMAKAIVIHICLPPGVCSSIFMLNTYYAKGEAWVTNQSKIVFSTLKASNGVSNAAAYRESISVRV